jgi:hypothetical protein
MPIMIFMTSYYPEKRENKRTVSVLRTKYLLIISFLVTAAFFLSSCEEKSTLIGIGILPPGDFTSTNATDTISVFSYTYSIDSVLSSNKTTYSYLGGLYDPYFGTTTTGFVGQLRILKKFEETSSIIIDSVKLAMTISGAKGVLGTQQEISIYEIDELLYPDSSYYSNRDPHASKHLATELLPIVKKDSAQTLYINLPVSVGQYLMRDPSQLQQDTLENDFRSFFNGIYCQMGPYTGTGPFFKGADTDSLMVLVLTFLQGNFLITVYYHTSSSISELYYDFTVNPNSARYNLFSHDFNTAEPDKRISHVNDNVQDTLSYLQGFNGVYTRIRIPALDSLKKMMPISVNKARLTIPVYLDGETYTAATVPTNIYMNYVGTDGKKYVVPDYSISPDFFNGSFSSTTKKYTFNLAAFTQYYLEGKIKSPELNLYFPEGQYKNVILKANHSTTPLKFEFTYTRY